MSLAVIVQAGAVVYRRDKGGLRILLVRARKNPEDWIFPKGHVEPDERPAGTAVREAEEEAGVTGRVVSTLKPVVTFAQDDRRIQVEYYLVEFTGEVKPKERREQVWLSAPKALERLTHDSARDVLAHALETLGGRR